MKIKLPKAAKGFEFGDVSNQAVRNILTGISREVYGKFTAVEMKKTLDYFGWKCPYTNEDLTDAIEKGQGDYAIDHIVPQNKEHCGLNVMGNLVYASKRANAKKGKKTAEEFLLTDTEVLGNLSRVEREARLKKIKDFQKECGYDPEAIQKALSPYFMEVYDDIRKEQEKRIADAIKLAGLTPRSSKKISGGDVPVIFIPSDIEEFKKQFLARKAAHIILRYKDSSKDKQSVWKADKFDSSSNLMRNIQSRPFWRTRKADGLLSVDIVVL